MDTVENVLFLLVGTALGYLANHIKDIFKGFARREWRSTVSGIGQSAKRAWPLLALLALALVGAYFVDRHKGQDQDARDAKLIETVKTAINESNKPLINSINTLIEEIRQERNGRANSP